jgi:uncharacterized glyoxalase superfamily protein PhnB
VQHDCTNASDGRQLRATVPDEPTKVRVQPPDSSVRRPGLPEPSPETTTIQLWWRASDAQALYEQARAGGVPILTEPFDGPFGRTFAMADPDGYRITVYEKDQPLFWPPKAG